MLAEKIIFNVLAFSLFVIMFFKMIKKNDTNYVVILCLQAVGIAINFIEIIFRWNLNAFMRMFIYLISVIIPTVIIQNLYILHLVKLLHFLITINLVKVF